MKLLEIIENNENVLSEGALTDALTKIFGKSISKTITMEAEATLRKSITELIQSKKKITFGALRNTKSYKDALSATVAEACRVKYGKSFDDLVNFNPNEAQKLLDEVQGSLQKELADQADLMKVTITNDLKQTQKDVTKVTNAVTAGKATSKDLSVATKNLKQNTRLQTRYNDVVRVIGGMDQMTVKQAQKLLSKEAKTIISTGEEIVEGGVKEGNSIFTGGKLFSISKEELKKFPGRIKRVIVNNPVKSILLGLGLGTAALYYFFGGDDADAIVLTDENGNALTDEQLSGWAPCIQELLKNKEGELLKNQKGEIYVKVVTAEYPQGLTFYTNGRIHDVAKNKMGSWKCKGGKTTLQEDNTSTDDATMASDVNKMINYLDFPVFGNDLKNAGALLKKWSDSGRGKEFLSLYQNSGFGGGSLSKSINNVITTEPQSVQAKTYIQQLIKNISSGQTTVTNNTKLGIGNIEITWDGAKTDDSKKTDDGKVPPPPKLSKYHDCSKKDVNKEPLELFCKSSQILEIQKCLGFEKKYLTGNFGPITMKALGGVKSITKEIYDKVKSNCKSTTPQQQTNTPQDTKLNIDYKKYEAPDPEPPKEDVTDVPTTTQTKVDYSTGRNEFYNQLKQNYGDGSNPTYPYIFKDGRRMKYKGLQPSAEDLAKLDSVMDVLQYRRIKQIPEKGYGIKYVWEKI